MKAEKGIIMKNLELQKKAELLEALVNDLCEETSAEETYERLLTLGTDIGITDEDLKDWGFDPFEDEEDEEEEEDDDDDWGVDWKVTADEYHYGEGNQITFKRDTAPLYIKVGDWIRVGFLDEFGDIDYGRLCKVIDKTDHELICTWHY